MSFTPAAGFELKRYVNVVRIVVDDTYVHYDSKPSQGRFFNSKKIYSNASAAPAMKGSLYVSAYGAPVNGTERGVSRIDFGFIQNVYIAQSHANFAAFRQMRVSKHEGQFYLDSAPGLEPWYDNDNRFHYIPSSDAPVLRWFMDMNDSPSLAPTDTWKLWHGLTYADVTAFHLWDIFTTYFATHSRDTDNGAANVYTQFASAIWSFNSSGTFPGTDEHWVPDASAGTKGDRWFNEITSGSVVPIVTGPIPTQVPIRFSTVADA